MENVLFFVDKEEWRSWLKQNYNSESYTWLVFYKRKVQKTSISLQEAIEEAICFGWIDGKLRSVDAEKFVVRFSPRKAKSVWSKINRERAEKMIALGRMTDAGLAKIDAAMVSGWWDKAYTNKIAEDVPKDLEQCLMKEDGAWENFQKFANSYRNMYVGWVNASKTSETRQKRIRKVVEQSIKNKKLLFL